MNSVEHQDYQIVMTRGDIEIRDYSPAILAEAEVSGERRQAIRDGFKVLADYIFGNNITMNRVVNVEAIGDVCGEKIPMTAPVMQERHVDSWKVRFVMPKRYSLETLPKPNCKRVVLMRSPAKRFAVIRFSGFPDDETLRKYKEKLEKYIIDEHLKSVGQPVLAFYNPPWTLPSLRRNEIMIEIDKSRDA